MGTKQKKEIKKEINEKEKARHKGIIPGIMLVCLGMFFLLDSLSIISFSLNYVLLIIGLIFILSYISTNNSGLLIPGVMLSLFGLILILKLGHLPYMWTLIISMSFFAVYLTKKEDTSWALIPGGILLAISAIILFNYYANINAFPLMLIIIGAYLIFKNYYGAKK